MNTNNWIYRGLQILFILAMGGAALAKITRSEQLVCHIRRDTLPS